MQNYCDYFINCEGHHLKSKLNLDSSAMSFIYPYFCLILSIQLIIKFMMYTLFLIIVQALAEEYYFQDYIATRHTMDGILDLFVSVEIIDY